MGGKHRLGMPRHEARPSISRHHANSAAQSPVPSLVIDRRLEQMRSADGRKLRPLLKEEIVREHERLCRVAKQLAAVETDIPIGLGASRQRPRLPRAENSVISQVDQLGKARRAHSAI
jgi:hypothetical protein